MEQTEPANGPTGETRRPRVALMGEFSAGKSTLTNLLLSGTPLPVRVTATRLPPVWISRGEPGAVREDLQGNTWPIASADLESVPLDDTRVIRLFLHEDILDLCDLIDMPGISDPNMPSETWERVIGEADHVIWCTHATQAWRQSEAAVWETVPRDLRERSILLVTRFDKIVTPNDRERVLSRVRRETRGLFSDFFPVSLTEALQSGSDRRKWETSGAEVFVRRLIDLLTDPSAPAHGTYGPVAFADAAPGQAAETGDVPAPEPADGPAKAPDAPSGATVTVLPRRVRPTGAERGRVTPRARESGRGGMA